MTATAYSFPGDTQEHRARFALQPFGSIRPSTRLQYTIKGIIPREGLGVIWGPPKQGKTFWTLDAAMRVALGWDYYGRKLVQGTVAYCLFEGMEGFRARIEAFRREHLSDDADPPFYLMAEKVDLIADHKALITAFENQLGDERPSVVVLDTLNRSLAGSESNDEDMSAYIQAADAIREKFGCVVLVIHHGPHDGNRPRGHSSLLGALDVLIKVTMTGDTGTAEVELAKDFESGQQQHFELKQLEVGTDDDGDMMTSCVIEPSQQPQAGTQKSPRSQLTPTQSAMLTILEEAGKEGLTAEEWNDRAREIGIGAQRQRLYEARIKLKRKSLIHQSQDERWHVTLH